jgi:hypothetical protein
MTIPANSRKRDGAAAYLDMSRSKFLELVACGDRPALSRL